MCGILGAINTSINQESFKRALEELYHRGPDAQKISSQSLSPSTFVLLGHTRLSILDLSDSGTQPMYFQNLSIVYNGETYNYADLRQDLVAKGYAFNSTSDTEVILKGFHYYGKKFLHKMIGMFAFCIYDKEKKEIFLFRDRLGVKPLYYFFDKKTAVFIFASELKALKNLNTAIKKLKPFKRNHFSEKIFLMKGYIPAPHTIYEDVYKLSPGFCLSYDTKSQTISKEQYWSLAKFYQKEKFCLPYKEIKSNLKELLIDACSLRMNSDVPVGVFLSGGVDSNLVTAILRKECGFNLKTFSLGVNDKRFNEANYAKNCSKALGTEHHELILKPSDMQEHVENFFSYLDEPFGDLSIIPTLALSKFAKQRVDVALSADGGDELFGGYDTYFNNPALWFKARLNPIPHRLLVWLLNKNWLSSDLKRKVLEFSELSGLEKFVDFHWYRNTYFKQSELNKIFSLNEKLVPTFPTTQKKLSKLSAMLLTDATSYLPDDVLFKVDRATMAYSLEGREPLLDHRLFEFCARIPDKYKVRKNCTKIIAKDILSEYLDLKLLTPKKCGFSIPINDCLSFAKGALSKDQLDAQEKTLDLLNIAKKNERSSYLQWLLTTLVIQV